MNHWLLLYEDRHWRELRPLTDLLPVPALAFGASDIATRWRAAVERQAPETRMLAIEARAAVMAAWRDAPALNAEPAVGDEVHCLNAAAIPGPWIEAVLAPGEPASFVHQGRVVGARIAFERMRSGLGRAGGFEIFLVGLKLPEVMVQARVLSGPWCLVAWNAEALAEDLAGLRTETEGEVHPQAVMLAPDRIAIAKGARVEALAVLDARVGPISLGPDVIVQPHTVVTGPCVVGAGTHLLGGSIGNSSIGPGCRLAGEVDSCIWQGWSNKRHHGFVGHSAIGEWVNLGALTTTSDLKNNYRPVRVWVEGHEIDTGEIKVGSFIGAGVRTGIGTLLPSGASIGVGSNLFGGGRFAPKHVAPFTWWDGASVAEHRFEKFLETARTAMARRERALSPGEEAALHTLYSASAMERVEAEGPARAARAG